MKEMFIRGGYNVYPLEVEKVLSTHPKVAEIAIVPRPDDVMGEIGVAVVVPARPARSAVARRAARARRAGARPLQAARAHPHRRRDAAQRHRQARPPHAGRTVEHADTLAAACGRPRPVSRALLARGSSAISASSERKRSTRRASTTPRTAHPGSRSCAQSANRQSPRARRCRRTLGAARPRPPTPRRRACRACRPPRRRRAQHELAGDGRVPALGVAGPHRLRRLQLVADEQVHELRLARARLADQRRRRAERRPAAQLVDARARRRGSWRGPAPRRRRRGRCRPSRRDRRVRLRQHDDRRGAAVPRLHKQALEAARRQRAVEAVHDRDRVDVGHQHLVDDRLRRVAPRERVAARQHPGDAPPCRRAGAEHDPVAGRRRDVALGARANRRSPARGRPP